MTIHPQPGVHRQALTALVLCLIAPALWAGEAEDLMAKNLAAGKVSGAEFRAGIRLISSGGQVRERITEGATKLQANGTDNMRVTRFISPADVKGTVTLLIEHAGSDDDMWIYLPAMKKVRRLATANKRDSFMGTDLTFGDVIGHRVSDWRHRVLGKKAIAGRTCTEIESVPVDETVRRQSGYARRVSCIDDESGVALHAEYADESGQPLKTVDMSDLKLLDSHNRRWQAMRIQARNQQSGHQTEIVFSEYTLATGIDPGKFRPQSLGFDL